MLCSNDIRNMNMFAIAPNPLEVYFNNPARLNPPAALLCNLQTYICSSGYYFQTTTCAACPSKPNSTPGESCQVTCNTGFFLEEPITTMPTADCTLCPAPPPNATMTTAVSNNFSVACAFTCNVGYILNVTNSSCRRCSAPTVACATGFQQMPCASGTSVDTCSLCSGSLFVNQNWDAQCARECNAGYYYQNSTACGVCGLGTYQPSTTKQTTCTACPSGYTTSVVSQATSCSLCQIQTSRTDSFGCTWPFRPCPAGFFLAYPYNASAECSPCPVGAYCTPTTNITLCPYSQYYSNTYSTHVNNCSVAPPVCRITQIGSTTREYVPWFCPAGTYTLAGAESVLQCRANAGYWYLPLVSIDGSQAALPCPSDTYCPDSAVQPVVCPVSTPFAPTGCADSSCCMQTPPLPCRAGYFANATVCVQCPPGTYCGGGVSYPQICNVNASGAYYSNAGATSIASCYSPNFNGIVVCPANTLGPVYTNGSLAPVNAVAQCRGSKGYYFSPAWGASAIVCPAGFYCTARSVWPLACNYTQCNLGLYQLATSVTTQCPIGTSSISVSVSACLSCPLPNTSVPFYFMAPGSCAVCCGLGYYSANGSTCSSIRQVCSNVNLYIPIPADPCVQGVFTSGVCSGVCATPSVSSMQLIWDNNTACTWGCSAGYMLVKNQCVACIAGTYKAQAGNLTQCVPCQNETNTFCSTCGVSPLYTPWSGSSSCLTCPTQAIASRDSTFCQCAPGTYMNSNKDQCVVCASDSVASGWGNTACTQCAPGTSCSIPH